MLVTITFVAAAIGQLADLVTFQMFYGQATKLTDYCEGCYYTLVKTEFNPLGAAVADLLGPWWILPAKLALGAILFALASRLKTNERRGIGLTLIAMLGFVGAAGNIGLLS